MDFDLKHEFKDILIGIHKSLGYTTNPWEMAEKLDFEMHYGTKNSTFLIPGSVPVITIDRCEPPTRRLFSAFHEICHPILIESGIQSKILHACCGDENWTKYWVEKFCDYGASLLLMPDHRVQQSLNRYGLSPMAIQDLAFVTGASDPAAMRRIVTFDDTQSVAGFLVYRGFVSDVVRHECRLPLKLWQQLPECHPIFEASEGQALKLQDEFNDYLYMSLPGGHERIGLLVSTFA